MPSPEMVRREKQLRRAEAEAIRKCSDALDELYDRDDAPQLVDGIILYLAHTKGFNVSATASSNYSWMGGGNADQWFFGTLDPDKASQERLKYDATRRKAKEV